MVRPANGTHVVGEVEEDEERIVVRPSIVSAVRVAAKLIMIVTNSRTLMLTKFLLESSLINAFVF